MNDLTLEEAKKLVYPDWNMMEIAEYRVSHKLTHREMLDMVKKAVIIVNNNLKNFQK